MSKIAAFKDLLKVVKKHKDFLSEEQLYLNPKTLEGNIRALEVSERFGVELSHTQAGDWLQLKNVYDEWTRLGLFGEKYGRTISWSDDGSQPLDEWLFKISFTTGAYIFGEGSLFDKSYPKKTFDAFFAELKSFGPAFVDSANHSLYFREDNSKAVYEAFWGIFNKYKKMVSEEMKEQRKQELLKELENLQ